MFLLKKKCGNFIGPPDEEGNRTTYKSGDKVPSDEDLVTKWPGKFELVGRYKEEDTPDAPDFPSKSEKKSKSKKATKKEDIKTKSSKSPQKIPVVSKYGVDVTEDFPTAAKVKLQVFEKLKWFTVIDPDNGEVLNEKKLRKRNVESFLEEYVPDEDEDAEEDEDEEEDDDDEDEDDD